MVVLRAILHFYSVSIDMMDFETKEQLTSFQMPLNSGECVWQAFRSYYRSKIRQVVVRTCGPTNLCGGTMRHPFPHGDWYAYRSHWSVACRIRMSILQEFVCAKRLG